MSLVSYPQSCKSKCEMVSEADFACDKTIQLTGEEDTLMILAKVVFVLK